MPSLSTSVVPFAFLWITLPAISAFDDPAASDDQAAGQKAFEQGRYREAESLFHAAVSALETASPTDTRSLAAARQNLATVYFAQGRLKDSEELYLKVIPVWESIPGRELSVAIVLNNLSSLLRTTARYGEAESFCQRALKILEDLGAAGQSERLRTLQNLGELYAAEGRYSAAQELLVNAMAAQQRLTGPESSDAAILAGTLAGVYRVQGKFDLAADLLQRALRITEASLGPMHPRIAVMLTNLAVVLAEKRKLKQSETLLLRAINIWEKEFGPNHPDLAAGIMDLAAVEFSRHRYKQAVELDRRALRINEALLGPNHPTVGVDLSNLGAALTGLRDYRHAEEALLRAIAISQRVPEAVPLFSADAWRNLGQLLLEEDRLDEAADACRRGIEIRQTLLGANTPRLVADLQVYAEVKRRLREYASAEAAEVRALGIQVRNTLHP